MKCFTRQQLGFSAFEGVLIVLVFSLIGIGGFYVYQRVNDASDTNQATTEQMAEEATPITSSEDLDTATDQLEAINIDELDTSELETIENELL